MTLACLLVKLLGHTPAISSPVVALARGSDSLPNVYRTDRYLIDGKTYEVFYFSGTSKHLYGDIKDTIPWKELTPIVMVDRVVMGKDWPYLDSLSAAHKIPIIKR